MKMYFVIKFYLLIVFLSDDTFSQILDAVPNSREEKLGSCQLKIKEAVSKCLSDSLEKICEERYSNELVSKDSENSYSSISSLSSSSPPFSKNFNWDNSSPLAKPSDFYSKEKKTFNSPRPWSSIKTQDETSEVFSNKFSDNSESLRPREPIVTARTSIRIVDSARKNNGDVKTFTTIPKPKSEVKPSRLWQQDASGKWINYTSTITNKKY
uniref:Venom protein Ci-27 n=1 Tax=Chelonus inanitus TaxID=49201 RepID=E6ZCJ4_9HYME|nr:venom protein Ci-27 [Chelonus inanitus]